MSKRRSKPDERGRVFLADVHSGQPERSSAKVESWDEGVAQRTMVTFDVEDILASGVPIAEIFWSAEARLEHQLEKDGAHARQVLREGGVPTGAPVYWYLEETPECVLLGDPRVPIRSVTRRKVAEYDMPAASGKVRGSKEALAGELLRQIDLVRYLMRNSQSPAECAEANQRLGELRSAFNARVAPYHKDGEKPRTAVDAAEAAAASRAPTGKVRSSWKKLEIPVLRTRRAKGHTNGQLADYICANYKSRLDESQSIDRRHVKRELAKMIRQGVI